MIIGTSTPSDPGRPVAFITGASSGIGRATALRFGAAGYRVAACYLRDARAAEAVAGVTDGCAYRVDVADPEAVASAVTTAEGDLGPIAVAVCNAGFYEERPLEEVTDERFDRMLRVHLGGCFHVARAAVPAMRARGEGSIVTVASELALAGGAQVSHYVAAKAAVLGFTRALAREVAPAIRANAIAPGAVDTPLLPDRDRGPAYTSTVPLRRIGRPEEVAEIILSLAEARWCTGATWTINGGVVIQ